MSIAIITGASSGIGEAFVREVAKLDYDEIWVLARRVERLSSLRDELGSKIVPTKIDLLDRNSITQFEQKLTADKPEIGLLINCAGMGKRAEVSEQTRAQIEETIELNCTALSSMTRICIPFLKERTPARKARIINIASSAGFLPQPGFAIYAASKSYVISFSRGLGYELKKEGITVTAVCPGPVNSEFLEKSTDGKETKFGGIRGICAVKAEDLAKAALKAAMRGKKLFVYGFMQKCLHVASKLLPTDVILWLETKLM